MTAREAQRVVDAWNVQGSNPSFHRAAQARLHAEWPTLAIAIEGLVAARRREMTS